MKKILILNKRRSGSAISFAYGLRRLLEKSILKMKGYRIVSTTSADLKTTSRIQDTGLQNGIIKLSISTTLTKPN